MISPGVFINEINQSGIAQGVADIGAVVVAPFPQGVGFYPTTFTDIPTLQAQFGTPDGTYYGPYTATQYLQAKGFVTVCRVGALTGYTQKYPFVIYAQSGEWTRAMDCGYLVSQSSNITLPAYGQIPIGMSFNTAGVTYPYTASFSSPGSISNVDGIFSGSGYFSGTGFLSGTGSINGGVAQSGSGLSVSGTSTITGSLTGTGSFSGTGSFTGFYVNTVYVSGSIELNGVASSLTLQPAQGTAIAGTPGPSGSLIYYGQTAAGNINGTLLYTGAFQVSSASFFALTGSAASASILSSILFSAGLSASFDYTQGNVPLEQYPPTFYTSQIISANSSVISDSQDLGNPAVGAPDIYIMNGGVITSTDHCGNVSLIVNGCLSGSFGYLDGGFYASSGVYNTCSFQWTGAPVQKVLAVLGNTQWENLNTSTLQVPGFYGSTLSSSYGFTTASQLANLPADNFAIVLSSSLGSGYGIYNFSLVESDPHYITNVFGNNPTAGNQATYAAGTKIESAYLYNLYPSKIAEVVSQPNNWKIFGSAMPSGSTAYAGEPLNFTDANSFQPTKGDSVYSLTNAYTPWILSQQIASWNGGTPTRFNLFQVATLADGTYANQLCKIQISNVKLATQVAGSDWGSFTLTVRAFDDTDRQPVILEQYNNLTLDPTSPNYIARVIGDQYSYINFNGKIVTYGIYANVSQYIRIQMADTNYPVTAVPYGFAAYSSPLAGGIGMFVTHMAYTKASVYGLYPGKYPSGVDFAGPPNSADAELIGLYPTCSMGVDAYPDNLPYFAPVPANSVSAGKLFALDVEYTDFGVSTGSFINGSTVISASVDPVNESTYVKMRNFILGFQGGFDGQAPSIPVNVGDNIVAGNTQGLNCANSTAAGSVAYAQCIGALSNADEWDINLITTPGIIYSLHSYVTNLVVDMCETRGDVFYILDIYEDGGNPATGQITETVDLAAEFDTSYAGTYYPWVRILDTNINQIVTVPPSVVLPAVYAASDNVSAEWFAVAGLNRGGIPGAVGVTDRVINSERDTLYEGKVNPIVSFPDEGFVVWGQKTLQNASNATNRISVRRLLINIKKFFASVGKYVLFEQSNAATWNKLLAIANPYLEGVQQRSGLYAFQLVMDASNNTPALEDQNIMVCQLWIKPTKTAEFLKIPITITTTGASFPTIS